MPSTKAMCPLNVGDLANVAYARIVFVGPEKYINKPWVVSQVLLSTQEPCHSRQGTKSSCTSLGRLAQGRRELIFQRLWDPKLQRLWTSNNVDCKHVVVGGP